jgi:hypothetical protein
VRRQVERGHPPIGAQLGVGEEVVVLAAVRAGGVEEEEVAAVARLLGEELRGAGRELDADVAAGHCREVGGLGVRVILAGRAAELEQPRDGMGVLRERLAAALDGELRHPGEQREQRLVARRRDRLPQPVPHLGRRRQPEVDAAVEAVVERVRDRRALAEVDPDDVVAATQREGGVGARADRAQAAVGGGPREPRLDEAVPVRHGAESRHPPRDRRLCCAP